MYFFPFSVIFGSDFVILKIETEKQNFKISYSTWRQFKESPENKWTKMYYFLKRKNSKLDPSACLILLKSVNVNVCVCVCVFVQSAWHTVAILMKINQSLIFLFFPLSVKQQNFSSLEEGGMVSVQHRICPRP